MVTKTIYTNVEVDVDLDDFGTDDLIDELELRGFTVANKEDSIQYEDRIFSLKEDFINWYQFGMTNEKFEKTLKQFFLDTVNEYIS